MNLRSLSSRIKRLEDAAQALPIVSPGCICFPKKEPPYLAFPVEYEIAAKVKCPLHGDRFRTPSYFVYVSKWLRKKLWDLMWTHHSPQYRKAITAAFPPDRWPAVEEAEDGRIFLRLKDGTRLLAT